MTDVPPATAQPLPVPAHTPFPLARMLCAIGFAFLAWLTLWLLFVCAFVQFVMFAIHGRINDEMKGFCLNLVQYLWELTAYVTFVRDEQPFPIGRFPRHA